MTAVRVRTIVVVDVDVEAWAAEYGLPPTSRDVREDVVRYLQHAAHADIASRGLAPPVRP